MTRDLFELDNQASGAEIVGPFRYSLFRRWNPARPWAAWLMCNPSTADETDNDPTLRRCIHFSKMVGAGGLRVVNVWAWRTPYPAELWPMVGTIGERDLARNLRAIREAGRDAGFRFVAFGAEPPRRDPLQVQLAVEALGPAPLCLGVNPDGFPLHPLARGRFAIPNDRTPVPWKAPWEPEERLELDDRQPLPSWD